MHPARRLLWSRHETERPWPMSTPALRSTAYVLLVALVLYVAFLGAA